MIYFRLLTATNPLFLVTKPFYLVLFLYFCTTSIDIYYFPLLIFKFKFTHVISFVFALLFLLIFRILHLPRNFTLLMIGLLISMSLSAVGSVNPTACIGSFLWMSFNFLFYFLVPYTLFYHIKTSTLLQIYFNSFFCIGLYAFLQCIFSLAGIILPGVTQYVFSLARGQAFTYEPSYYALYMTPLAFFYTTQFLLQTPNKRHLHRLIWPNFLLLISTSTGCFFSYIIYLIQIILFKCFKILKIDLTEIVDILRKFILAFMFLFILIWCIDEQLIISGFLKFFFHGTSHGSIRIRWQGVVDYWNMFIEHPIFGVGLGAGPFYHAQKTIKGIINLLDPLIVAQHTPTNALTEVFASLGLVGVGLFTVFFFLLINTFRTTYRISSISSEEKINLIAMILSIGVMLATLQFNQGITRPYLWVHVGIFVGYANMVKKNMK